MLETQKYGIIIQVLKKEITQKNSEPNIKLNNSASKKFNKSCKKKGIDGIIHKNKGKFQTIIPYL